MKQHLNTLFVTTQGSYLFKEGASVGIRFEEETRFRIPMHNIGGIACFGNVACSPYLMASCAESGVSITFFSPHGRFLAAVQGFTSGNVLLRREQYRRADDPVATTAVARNIVAAKIANCRSVLLRGARDYPHSAGHGELVEAGKRLARCATQAKECGSLDIVRGIEGEGASAYFKVFGHLITGQRDAFEMRGRSRRPPRDPTNALLSFLYSMLSHDARSACEGVGLDSAVGFLHRDRPGRPSLALDLMEEFRPFIADRLALTLINRQQVKPDGFKHDDGGGYLMDESTRKTVITAYQERKQDTIRHPFLDEEVSIGLLVHLQARLLARHLRGDLDEYPAFVWR